MGSQVELEDHTLTIHTPCINKTTVSTEVGGLNRIAVSDAWTVVASLWRGDYSQTGW